MIRWIAIALLLVSVRLWAEEANPVIRVIDSPFLLFDLDEQLSADAQLADYDGDGDLDVAIANGRHWAAPDRVYLNNGRGRLLTALPLGQAHRPSYLLASADLDGDGDIDIVAVYDDLPARVWLNDGKASFADGGTIGGTGGDSRSGLLSDLSGDGVPDLVLARRGDPDLLLLGDGRGGFDELLEFALFVEVADDIASADELAIDVELGDRGPA